MMMDHLLLVNGCSCDSLVTTDRDSNLSTSPSGGGVSAAEQCKRRLCSKSYSCALSELENLDRLTSATTEEQQPQLIISSPIKRPRLLVSAANASPLIPGSESASTEDVWQAFNGFLDDDAIITTCQEEPGIPQPSTSALSFSEFVKRYNELSEWLGRIQQSVTTTVGVSRAELYLHQTVHADLASRQSDRRSLGDYGRQLLAQRCGPLSDPAMQREIAGYLQSLTHRWQVVERCVTTASGNSPPCIDQVFQDLEADLELLRQWLDNTEESLASCRLPPSSCRNGRSESEQKHIQECASLLFERCKAIQVQIQSQQRFVSAVRRLSDRLASGSQEFLVPPSNDANEQVLLQEKAEAYRSIAEQLENRWQQLWLVSLEVHCRLENVLNGNNQQSAPRSEVIRPVSSGHDLFAATYFESHLSSSGGGSSRPASSSNLSIGFTPAFANNNNNNSNNRHRQSDPVCYYRRNCHHQQQQQRYESAGDVHTTASNSLDILPFSDNEYEHIATKMTETLVNCNNNNEILRRTHSEADCSITDRTPIKHSHHHHPATNRNNYSPDQQSSKNQKTRRARSETFGSQYQMYFAASGDDSDGHYLDELTAKALNGNHHHQLALTLPRTASSDSPLPTSADFISTNDTPSSGSGGQKSGQAQGVPKTQQRRYQRRSTKDNRYYNRRRHAYHASTVPQLGGSCSMQRSHTYNENLIRQVSDCAVGSNGRASSLDGNQQQLSSSSNSKKQHRKRRDNNSQSSSLYSSEDAMSGTESGCSADGDDGAIEESDRLHSTDAVRAAMHRFRWKYCRRANRYASQRSASLTSVDAAHKFSISESAIQELHEIYEAYCAKYSTSSIKADQVKQPYKTSLVSSTTTAMLPPEDQQAIGVDSNSNKVSPRLKAAACRSWESESSTLNKTWKRLVTLGQDVAAPSNFIDQNPDSPKLCDTTLTNAEETTVVSASNRAGEGLLRLVDEAESSDGGLLSANERGDVDWDAYQPPVYTASSDDADQDDIRRARNMLLLSEEGLNVDDDNYGDQLDEVELVPTQGDDQSQDFLSPRRRRVLTKRRQGRFSASLTSVLEYSAASLDEVTLGLSTMRLEIRTSQNVDTLAAECRHLLEIADDNLAQLQDVHRRLSDNHHAADLAERVDTVVTVWQRVLADLLGEQRRADDLMRALDELHAINDVIPAIEQRIGFPVSSSPTSPIPHFGGIFRFDSAAGMLEASEESLRIATSISQLHLRASSILQVIQQIGNDPLQEQVGIVLQLLDHVADFNAKMRDKCVDLYAAIMETQTAMENCESGLLRIEKSTGDLQSDLTKWAQGDHNYQDDDISQRLSDEVANCESDLSRLVEPSLTDLEARFNDLSVSEQAVSAFRTRLGAIRARTEGERGRLDTLRVAISLATSPPPPPTPKTPSSRDSSAQTFSADAQTLPLEPASKPSPSPVATTSTSTSEVTPQRPRPRSWARRFARLIFPAQLAIVSIFLILRFLEPFEIPIRVTPLLNFNHGPPPV